MKSSTKTSVRARSKILCTRFEEIASEFFVHPVGCEATVIICLLRCTMREMHPQPFSLPVNPPSIFIIFRCHENASLCRERASLRVSESYSSSSRNRCGERKKGRKLDDHWVNGYLTAHPFEASKAARWLLESSNSPSPPSPLLISIIARDR